MKLICKHVNVNSGTLKLLILAGLLMGAAGGCGTPQRQIISSPQTAARVEVLEDEVLRLRSRLQSSREELQILTNSWGTAVPADLRSRATLAREQVYSTAETERDLRQIKKSLERAIAATDAEIRVFQRPLRTN